MEDETDIRGVSESSHMPAVAGKVPSSDSGGNVRFCPVLSGMPDIVTLPGMPDHLVLEAYQATK